MNQPPYLPIKHSFDSETGIVTFRLDPRYHFQGIRLNYGYYPQPDFDDETSEVSFRVLDLAEGEHEFILFTCQKGDGDKAKQIHAEFELLHQGTGEILITLFYGGLQHPRYRHTYAYNY